MNENNTPKTRYSIIVTVYNAEKYLKQCLESVEKQTYKNWEMILINDGSSDASGIIAREFGKYINSLGIDSTVTYLEHENRGAVYSREKGICRATGEYLLFLDADDWWDDNLIESVNKIANDTDADIIQYGYKFRDENGLETAEFGQNRKGGNGQGKLILDRDSNSFTYKAISTCYSLWSRAIRRDLFDKEEGYYRNYYDIAMTNDLLAFSRPLSLAKTYCFTDIYPYNYRLLPDSVCHSNSINKICSYCRSLGWAEKCLRERNGLTDEHETFFAQRIVSVLFGEYRDMIYGGTINDTKSVYDALFMIYNADRYIRATYKISDDWYERIYLLSFIKRLIFVPRVLRLYTKLKLYLQKLRCLNTK